MRIRGCGSHADILISGGSAGRHRAEFTSLNGRCSQQEPICSIAKVIEVIAESDESLVRRGSVRVLRGATRLDSLALAAPPVGPGPKAEPRMAMRKEVG